MSRIDVSLGIVILILVSLFFGCNSNSPVDNTSITVDTSRGGSGSDQPKPNQGTLFTRLSPADTGVDFVNPIDPSHPLKQLFAVAQFCGGVSVGDVNGDGRADVYLTGGPRDSCLYVQTDNLQFKDVTTQAGVAAPGVWSTGSSMADVDDDGDLDIYVCNYDAPNLLFINQGDGTFVDEAHARGVDFVDASQLTAFCDYDLDGDLDFYLATYKYVHPEGSPKGVAMVQDGKKIVVKPEYRKYFRIDEVIHKGGGKVDVNYDIRPRPDQLFRNDGSGKFTNVTEQAGVASDGFGLSLTWWDYNGDQLPDLYVGNDFRAPDHLYQNQGDGTFVDVIEQAAPHTTWFSMGADFADLNGNGLFDFLIADMSATNHFKQKTNMGAMGGDVTEFLTTAVPRQFMRNTLYVNAGVDHFMEGAFLAGLANSDWTWSVKLADFDNDGKVDVYLTNGMSRNFNASDAPAANGRSEWDTFAATPKLREQNLAYRNEGDLLFSDTSQDWGLDHVGISGAAAYADLDDDGDLDLIVANIDEPVSIYRNDSPQRGLSIRLVGKQSNAWGLGAKVTLTTSDGTQVRMLSPMTGYLSSNDPRVHFGIRQATKIDRLTIQWPSGHVQTLEDIEPQATLTITEPDGSPAPRVQPEAKPTKFASSDLLENISHRETDYDDYQYQPLLPNKMSQLGPGMAWGDVDGDGDEDLYFGQGSGYAGQLLLRDGGEFVWGNSLAFENDIACEDMGALFFDADGDDDLDLYVVSGSVECSPEDEVLRDRLYLNDGQGTFSKAPKDALPDVRDSGSVVCAADFDRDGDLDLFVGGRVIPGQYPLSPNSRLLRNEGGRFTDATDQVASGLRQSGLVTGAIWSDVDADGWVDLAVTHEWGPIKLFRNVDGKLRDDTARVGRGELFGWWNGISGGDFDHDGDIDLVVTNFGLNTKYHANTEKPALLYYGDFEGNGRMRLVEAEYEDETLFPVRGKSCSSNAMPHLFNKFTTFTDFAKADLPEVYTEACLKDAHRFSATVLESGVLINDGKGKFSFTPLPRIAQIAPGFGVMATDVDGDGNCDIYLAQNFYGPQPETGRMAGGLSQLLRGRGDGSFSPVSHASSGLIVPDDAKSLTRCDLNGDHWPDFVVGTNAGSVRTFVHQTQSENRRFAIKLMGSAGNRTAAGARVQLSFDDGSQQLAEVYAGDSYLSQSSPIVNFGLGTSRPKEVTVRWPDGSTSSHACPTDGSAMMVVRKDS